MKNRILALAALAALGLPAAAQATSAKAISATPATPTAPAAPTAPAHSWQVVVGLDAATLNNVDYTSQVFSSPTPFPDMTRDQAPWKLADLLAKADGRIYKVPRGNAITFERDWDGEGLLSTLVGFNSTQTTVAITSNDPSDPPAVLNLAGVKFTDWWLFSENGTTRERAGFTADTRVVTPVVPAAPESMPE